MAKLDWFKFSVQNDAIIYALPDKQAGRVLKAALWYFNTGEEPQLDPASQIVFAALKRDIDNSKRSYAEQSERNREKVLKRWRSTPEK